MEKIRKIKRSFTNANMLSVEVEHNGFQGGDAGHGGYVKIKISDESSTWMKVTTKDDGEFTEEFTLEMRGDTERQTLIQALSLILAELLINPYINE